MQKSVSKFFCLQKLWANRILNMLLFTFFLWICLPENERRSVIGIQVALISITGFVLIGAYYLLLPKNMHSRHVAHAIHQDWTVTYRVACLMLAHMIMLGIYGVYISTHQLSWHWLASFSGVAFLFAYFKSESECGS